MAMVQEIMEAAHGNNNDSTLMVNGPKAFFVCYFQFYSPPVLSPPPLPLQQERPQESVFHSS